IIMAVGLEVFLVPNQVIDGGIVGISIMLSHLSGISLGIFLFVLNLPFIYIGYKQIGKTFAFSTLYGIVILSISTALLHPVP
ncbi:YitT family protein, partial [Planococcus sp. SIMBA_143]